MANQFSLSDKEVKKSIKGRRLFNFRKREIITGFVILGLAPLVALAGRRLYNGPLCFVGFIMPLLAGIYAAVLDAWKQKQAERAYMEHYHKTGQLLPEDWKFTDKQNGRA